MARRDEGDTREIEKKLLVLIIDRVGEIFRQHFAGGTHFGGFDRIVKAEKTVMAQTIFFKIGEPTC